MTLSPYSRDLAAAIKAAEVSLGDSPRAMITSLHLLLGMLQRSTCSASMELENRGFSTKRMSEAIRNVLDEGAGVNGEGLWSREAKEALERAFRLANEAGTEVRTIHLLKAIVEDKSSAAALVLEKLSYTGQLSFGEQLLKSLRTFFGTPPQ